MDSQPGGQQALAIARRIPAPPDAVFAAWVEPERLKTWWGTMGWTTTEAEVEPRPGGRHLTRLRDAAGQEFPFTLRIAAIDPPHRLELVAPEGALAGTRLVVSLAPEAGGTRLDAVWHHPTPEARAAHRAMAFERNWGERLDRLHAAATGQEAGCPMATPPAPEHGWLHRLVGDWEFEHEATMPDGTPATGRGIERVRALGPYWVIGEGEGGMPGGGTMCWRVTMGFDTETGRFTGSWVGSMMGNLFVYDGALSEDRTTLTLENEGPAFGGPGRARYRDIVTLETDDLRRIASEVQGEDGSWTRFMSGSMRRTA